MPALASTTFAHVPVAEVERAVRRRLIRSTSLSAEDCEAAVDAMMAVVGLILEDKDSMIRKLQEEADHNSQHDDYVTNK